ncbi:MAG: hemolysin family protein [Parachlamydiaceae bacterium]
MKYNALIWLVFNLLSIVVLAFYSMLEMACVSFNKVRLQYYASKGSKRMLWLNDLLQHPSRLFGTTLIGVNIALVIGSECSRECYAALGISPDLAPLTQVALVVIFGELAPMFAARRYPEHVARLGIPLIYASAMLMTPLLIIIDWISKIANFLLQGNQNDANIYLTQEELLKILEEQSEDSGSSESDEFSTIAENIFALRDKRISQVMEPIESAILLPSDATIDKMEEVLNQTGALFLPLYHRHRSNIIGIIFPREALRAAGSKRVRDLALPPWFVTETTGIMQVLKQFRTNSETVAIILNSSGKAIGIVTLDDVLEAIFEKISRAHKKESLGAPALESTDNALKSLAHAKFPVKSVENPLTNLMLIEKTFPGEMTVREFHQHYGISLAPNPELTLADIISNRLGHHPEKGESIFIAPFELTVKETTLTDIKTISISTIF